MGRLGYQSEAQASLAVSYNGLAGYGATLEDAMTRIWPAYEAIGLRDADGGWRQLSTHLLQIENEFYGTIRPKRTIRSGERPLHALRQRGVEYVEVRCMDLDPFEPLGIGADTARVIDLFLLHCLASDSPPDSPDEIAALSENQQRVAARGREPGLRLTRGGAEVLLVEWAAELLEGCEPIARRMDAALGGQSYRAALAGARDRLLQPESLPSARVLQEATETWRGEYTPMIAALSQATRRELLARPLPTGRALHWAALADQSLRDQAAIEAAQQGSFDDFVTDYLDSHRLLA
jgi:glutamate--cysteine ligase